VCEFLATLADTDGHVPIVTAKIRDYPRAARTDPPTSGDSPNPTASLAGLLLYQGIEHRWLARATEWCWKRLKQPIGEAHEILNALTFVEHVPDRSRAQTLASKVAAQIDAAKWYLKDPASLSYGVTPLQLCPRPRFDRTDRIRR
jgi:hypothetical protein